MQSSILSDYYTYLTKNGVRQYAFALLPLSFIILHKQEIMKSNDKKKKELKKVKSDGTIGKGLSEYQQDKTRKSIIEPSPFRPKK